MIGDRSSGLYVLMEPELTHFEIVVGIGKHREVAIGRKINPNRL